MFRRTFLTVVAGAALAIGLGPLPSVADGTITVTDLAGRSVVVSNDPQNGSLGKRRLLYATEDTALEVSPGQRADIALRMPSGEGEVL